MAHSRQPFLDFRRFYVQLTIKEIANNLFLTWVLRCQKPHGHYVPQPLLKVQAFCIVAFLQRIFRKTGKPGPDISIFYYVNFTQHYFSSILIGSSNFSTIQNASKISIGQNLRCRIFLGPISDFKI